MEGSIVNLARYWVWVVLAGLGTSVAGAQPVDSFISSFETTTGDDDFIEGPPWQEELAALPPVPKEQDLQKIEIDRMGSFDVYVDPASISVGGDEVVRYTIVLASELGATNLFYEGIICSAEEYKTYAIGSLEAGFQKIEKPVWQAVRYNLDFHYDLVNYYFCDQQHPRSLGQIVRTVKGQESVTEDFYRIP